VGKRGPPPTPDDVKELRGTMRKDRMHPREVPLLHGGILMPRWLRVLCDPLSNAERQARYRARSAISQTPIKIRAPRRAQLLPRPRRWRDAIAELLAVGVDKLLEFLELSYALRHG
jgi:hypothetical protein